MLSFSFDDNKSQNDEMVHIMMMFYVNDVEESPSFENVVLELTPAKVLWPIELQKMPYCKRTKYEM